MRILFSSWRPSWLRSILTVALTFTILVSQSQLITGKIIDANTKEPVPFANVFFSGTLIGTTSNVDGTFKLIHGQEGVFDLAVTYVGYIEQVQTLDVSQSLDLEIRLEPQVIQLRDVWVNADTAGRKYNYQSFEELLLGRTRNSLKTAIQNPDDVFVYFDKKDNALFAHSKEDLVVENKALGYRLIYKMSAFEMFYRTGELRSYGLPRFEEIEPKSKGQKKKWGKQRERAYRGSFEHFLRALIADSLSTEGFTIQEVVQVANRKRPPQDLIDEKIKYYTERRVRTEANNQQMETGKTDKPLMITDATGTMRFKATDSLVYWIEANKLPLLIDTLGQIHTSNKLLVDSENPTSILFTGTLKVIYKNEREEERYALTRMSGGVDNKQTSFVTFKEPIAVARNFYFDIRKLLFQGYWAWSSGLAEMLPLGYSPEKSN